MQIRLKSGVVVPSGHGTRLDPSVVVPFPVIRGNTVITNIKGKRFQCLAFFAETQSLTVWIGHLH